MENYVALDLETTGLSPKNDRILEIGAVKIEEGRETGRIATLIDPQMKIPERITALTGISQEMVRGMPVIGEVIGELVEFCEGFPLLGHNIIFDFSFVKQWAVNSGFEFEHQGIDTLKIARVLVPELPEKGLQALRMHYQIEQEHAHRAFEDALVTHKLYQRFIQEYEASNPDVFKPYPLVYKAKKQSPATPRQKRYLHDLIKYHRIDSNVETDALTKSEASRLIDKILSSYGRIME